MEAFKRQSPETCANKMHWSAFQPPSLASYLIMQLPIYVFLYHLSPWFWTKLPLFYSTSSSHFETQLIASLTKKN